MLLDNTDKVAYYKARRDRVAKRYKTADEEWIADEEFALCMLWDELTDKQREQAGKKYG